MGVTSTLILLFGLGVSARAEVCTVSVLNQSAPVRSDGTWFVPNIPSNLGEVRARVSCVENGVLTTATSRRFQVVTDGMTALNPLGEDPPAATPTRIEASSPDSQLSFAGQQVQISVTAHFVGGGTVDVTSPGLGTRFASSNSDIASIDGNGLLTAHRSGKVLAIVLHEALVDTLAIGVVLSGDSDGDGLPDDFERANGLDPGEPVDALEDADLDGLTNLTEYQLGTAVRNQDTDSDGIGDGREVNLFGTNPLLGDTDGDGVWDGLELQIGSDPLDPLDFDLAAALASIEIDPPSFALVYNTVLGEASRQVRVLGHLIDGRILEITRPPYGTTYSSSDLTRVSFGPEPGRLYAGEDGVATVTATNGQFVATTMISVTRVVPRVTATLSLPGCPNSIVVDGQVAFIPSGAVGLLVVDVSNRANPVLISRIDTPGNANAVAIRDGMAFVADGQRGVTIVDVSSPASPSVVSNVDTDGDATDIVLAGSFAFVADGAGLAVVNVAMTEAPFVVATLPLDGDTRGIDLLGSLALVAADTAGLHVIDVSSPASPLLVSTLALRADETSHAADVSVNGGLAYVADGAHAFGRLRVVSLESPENPVVVAESATDSVPIGTAFDRDFVYGLELFRPQVLPVYRATTNPLVTVASLVANLSGAVYGHGISARDLSFFSVLSSSPWPRCTAGNGKLVVGALADEDGDSQAPEVELERPVAGSTLRERWSILLDALATDDYRIQRFEFVVDGDVVRPVPWFPTRARIQVPVGVTELRVQARAYDFAGNMGVSEEVTFPVLPDDSPQIALLAPVEGTTAAGGSVLTVAATASDDVGVALVRFNVNGITHDDFVPPYRTTAILPTTTGSILVSAIAFDAIQASEPTPTVAVAVDGDDPPVAAVISPLAGAELVANSSFEFVGGATDDIRVQSVRFLVDGVEVDSDSNAPYVTSLSAPAAGDSLTLQVEARDNRGQVTLAPSVVVHGVPDPGMTIQGSLRFQDATPVPFGRVLAETSSSTAETLTDAAGGFELGGVTTQEGWVNLRGDIEVSGQLFEGFIDGGLEPLPGSVVEVGELVLLPTGPPGQTGLVGRVVDSALEPIEGAAVEVATYFEVAVATTLEDGTFHIEGFPAQHGQLEVRARANLGGVENAGAISDVTPVAGDLTEMGDIEVSALDLGPDPWTTVVGSVVLEGGGPAAGATVVIRTDARLLTTVTLADGTFVLNNVPTLEGSISASSGLALVPAHWGSASGSEPIPSGTTDLGTIFLRPGGTPGV